MKHGEVGQWPALSEMLDISLGMYVCRYTPLLAPKRPGRSIGHCLPALLCLRQYAHVWRIPVQVGGTDGTGLLFVLGGMEGVSRLCVVSGSFGFVGDTSTPSLCEFGRSSYYLCMFYSILGAVLYKDGRKGETRFC